MINEEKVDEPLNPKTIKCLSDEERVDLLQSIVVFSFNMIAFHKLSFVYFQVYVALMNTLLLNSNDFR